MVVLKEVSSMFWGITLDGGKRYTQTVERSFNITMAAIEPPPSHGKLTPVSVMVQIDKAEFLLCTLGYGNLLQQKLELLFTEGEEVTFFLNGSGVVHLTGFLIDDQMEDSYPENLSSEESDSEDAPELVEEDSEIDSEDEDSSPGKKRKMISMPKGKKKIKTIGDIDEDDDDESDDEFEVQDFDEDDDENDFDMDDDLEDDDSDDVPQKHKETPKQFKEKKKENTNKQKKAEQNQSKSEVNTPAPDVEGKKKKKKKKKKKQDESTEANKKSINNVPSTTETPKKRVLSGGLVCEEVKNGHGPEAKAGKVVSVYYIGKLSNGKQFDSCQTGKPFKFRLGHNEVIKGWDQGIQGMKVGGKRKLTIPAPLAYGSQRQGPIPPNSTLMFDVELKFVS